MFAQRPADVGSNAEREEVIFYIYLFGENSSSGYRFPAH